MYFLMNLALNPLQSAAPIPIKKASIHEVIIVFSVMGIVVLAIIVLNIIKNRYNISAFEGTQSADSSPRRFSVIALYRLTSNLGLDREQHKILEFVLRNDGVSDPERSLSSPTLLDRHFKRAYRAIERTSISEEELNHRLSILFAVRNIIETSLGTTTTTSTRQIPENAAAVLAIDDKNYPVRVISSRGDSLVVENPLSGSGGPLRLPRGHRISLSFFTKSSKGFSVESRILGSTETADGPVLQLVHSGQIKRLSNRRFRRRQTVISTAYYLVHIEDAGRKGGKKMVVEKRKFSGNIMDISIGGCSIKTTAAISDGQRLKIEFTREDNSIVVALGEVLRTNRAGTSTVMNIRFLRIPRKSLNSINAMVYEYVD